GRAHAREGLLYSAGAAYSRATLQHQHSLVRSCQVRRAGQTIVARSDDNHVPPARGQFADGRRQSNFAQDGGRGRDHRLSIGSDAPSWEADTSPITEYRKRTMEPSNFRFADDTGVDTMRKRISPSVVPNQSSR